MISAGRLGKEGNYNDMTGLGILKNENGLGAFDTSYGQIAGIIRHEQRHYERGLNKVDDL